MLLVVALCGCLSVAAESPAPFKIMTEELRPFGYVENGQLTGVCVDIVRALLERLDHPDQIHVYPWDRAYQEVQHQPGRILFSMGRSPAREELFKWVGPLLSNVTYLYRHQSSALDIHTLDDARRVGTIAVRENYFAHTLLAELGFTNLFLTREGDLDVQMLVAGRTDLIAVGELSLQELCRAGTVDCHQIVNTGVPIQDSKLYLAFSRSTPDTEIQRWQRELDALRASPVYAEILRRYLPSPVGTP